MQCLFRWILTLEAILRVLVCSRELIWMQNHTKPSSHGWKCWIRLSNLNSCEICNVFHPLIIFVRNKFHGKLKGKKLIHAALITRYSYMSFEFFHIMVFFVLLYYQNQYLRCLKLLTCCVGIRIEFKLPKT